MSSIEHAVETINQRATVTVDDFDSTCPATRTMPRRDWLDFLQRESKRTNITFYNRTDGSRLKKNKVFLKHFGNHDGTPYDGPLPEDHENKKRRMEMNFKEESILQGNPLLVLTFVVVVVVVFRRINVTGLAGIGRLLNRSVAKLCSLVTARRTSR